MMQLHFHKYHGTGNDFILLDNRTGKISLSRAEVAGLCHRRFGIGADGLMLLETTPDADFRMIYYNSDGGESTMCGNGGRCIVAFAYALGIIKDETQFLAIDGLHLATVEPGGIISLGMKDVDAIHHYDGYDILDTGSPHFILAVNDTTSADVFHTGRSIRNEARFAPDGINVNFVSRQGNDSLSVRTYERGVEDETLSCGTGVTAAAIAASGTATGNFSYQVQTPGGRLEVRFTKAAPDTAQGVILRGPAVRVFEGDVLVSSL
jgi:diaminopimelate epimerase